MISLSYHHHIITVLLSHIIIIIIIIIIIQCVGHLASALKPAASEGPSDVIYNTMS